MSHQMTSSLITTVGRDYDLQVHLWKQDIVSELESTRESEVNATIEYRHDINSVYIY